MTPQNVTITQDVIDAINKLINEVFNECDPDGHFFQKMKGKAKTDFIHPKKLKPAKLGIFEDYGSFNFIDEKYDIINRTIPLVNDVNGNDYEINLRTVFVCYNDLYYKWIEETFHVPSKQYILKIKIKSDVLFNIINTDWENDYWKWEKEIWDMFEWDFILDENQEDSDFKKSLLEDFISEISEYTDVTLEDFNNRAITKKDFK